MFKAHGKTFLRGVLMRVVEHLRVLQVLTLALCAG